jgi:hypothetical protein
VAEVVEGGLYVVVLVVGITEEGLVVSVEVGMVEDGVISEGLVLSSGLHARIATITTIIIRRTTSRMANSFFLFFIAHTPLPS